MFHTTVYIIDNSLIQIHVLNAYYSIYDQFSTHFFNTDKPYKYRNKRLQINLRATEKSEIMESNTSKFIKAIHDVKCDKKVYVFI